MATDPTGGCPKGCSEDDFLAKHCWCFESATAEHKRKEGGGYFEVFTVTVKGYWTEPPEGQRGGPPGFEWWEHFKTMPSWVKEKDRAKLKVNAWNDMTAVFPKHPAWYDPFTSDAFVEENKAVPITDYPGAQPGLAGDRQVTQDLWIAVRVASTPGCPCKAKTPPRTFYAHQTYDIIGPNDKDSKYNFITLDSITSPPGNPTFNYGK